MNAARGRTAALLALMTAAAVAACASAAPSPAAVGLAQIGAKLTDRSEHGHEFGQSVALSGDGKTALIGETNIDNDNGAAAIYVRSGSGWKQQGPLLLGTTHSNFGSTVALSANGNTALVTESIGVGYVWVYARSGSTWTRQAKLMGHGEEADSEFGEGLALSGDGSTAVVGDPLDHDDTGAVWVFTRSGSTWQQGPELTGHGVKEGSFGQSVAVSRDGATVFIGWAGVKNFAGAVQVYSRSGSAWKAGPTLTGRNEGGAAFGTLVALSDDGDTAAVIGLDLGGPTKAWVLTRAGTVWAQTELKGNPTYTFGNSVALSGDGKTALIGADKIHGGTGTVFVYTRSGTKWTLQKSALTPSDEAGAGAFGTSVSVSTNGQTALIGSADDNHKAGAAWIFASRG